MGLIYSILKSPYFLTNFKNMGHFFIFRQTSTQSKVLTCSSKVLRTNHEAKVLSMYRSVVLARKCAVMCDQPPFSLWACACICVVHPFCYFHCPEPHERWKQIPYPVLGDLQWLHVHMKAAAATKKAKWTSEVGILIPGWSQGMMLQTGRSTRKTAPTAEKYFEVQMCHVGGFVSFFFKYSSIFSSQWNLHHTDAALSWFHVFNSSVCLSPWLHWCS